jgi:hypothetical protein
MYASMHACMLAVLLMVETGEVLARQAAAGGQLRGMRE